MPLTLKLPPARAVPGVRLATVAAGIKKDGVPDLVLIELPANTAVAGVFTRNHFAAAPVQLCRKHLALNEGQVRALLVNSGNANAGTGAEGLAATRRHCQWTAEVLSCSAEAVLPFSTGVIGVQLPDTPMQHGIASAAAALGSDMAHWEAAARGIMTTDTQPKISSRLVQLPDGRAVTLTGMAKGAGMIEPHMATMLAYLFCDAVIEPMDLEAALREAVDLSFNAISVDSDTSTNDSCVMAATGQGVALAPGERGWDDFNEALQALCLDLAQAIVRDAEGASKFIRVAVCGGRDVNECRRVAYAIANSPLVKTALFASDANVGRLLMAIGKADVEHLDPDAVRVMIGSLPVFERGAPAAGYSEAAGAAAVAGDEIDLQVDLARGNARSTVYCSDLSHDYVSINADYRS